MITTTKGRGFGQRSKPAKAKISKTKLIYVKGSRRYIIDFNKKTKEMEMRCEQKSASKTSHSWFDVKLSDKQKFEVKIDVASIFAEYLSQ